jgi:hypothetical protein
MELVAYDLRSMESHLLWRGSHAEIDVSPDGLAVSMCTGQGHLGMGLAKLDLVPPESADRLPTASGEPADLVRSETTWHVHQGGWGRDSKSLVYVLDADRSNIKVLIEAK